MIYKIKKCCDHGLNYNSRVPNSNTIEINGRDNKNDFTTGLNVTKNSIQFYSTKSSNAFVPTEGGANYWTCTIDQYGNLTVKDVFGSSLVKNVNDKVKSIDEAIQGAKYIIAEWISDNASYRKYLRSEVAKTLFR